MKNICLLIFTTIVFGLSASAQTSLMSYNIKHANERDGENSWSKRKEFFANQIKFYEPDILGVQEALVGQLDFLTQTLPDYRYLGIGREGGEKGEFSAILYNAEKFEVLRHDTFWLSETPNKISKGWDADYHRVCTYALFKDKKAGVEFYVFNTHFDHQGDLAREKSAALILEKISSINSAKLPVFLMGDFNLEPASEPIKAIVKVLEDSKEAASEVVFGPEGTFNGYDFDQPVTKRIDYIFTSKSGVEVMKYAVLSDSWNLKYPSDHLPVFITARFISGN